MPLFSRIELMAEHLCDKLGLSLGKMKRTFIKNIKENINIKPDYRKLYAELYMSKSFVSVYKNEENIKLNVKKINYEDALCFIYLKGLLNGFPYSNLIKQIVIDEAQDYNKLQYLIIKKTFKTSNYTILGDTNQTINPYYKYDSLEELTSIFESSKYITLTKTYRSTGKIIDYTNKILGLNHVTAIRRENSKPVIYRSNISNLKKTILDDLNVLSLEYLKMAIIAKDHYIATKLYNTIKNDINVSLINDNTKEINSDLVIIPAYLAKGLEFDCVIVYNDPLSKYKRNEKNLLYVACTRAQHELYIYN